MASKAERTIINAAGLAQGIVLVTFPAASTIFTDISEYGLSSTQYGAMEAVPNRTADRPSGPRSWLGLVLCRGGKRWHDRAYLETCGGWRRHAEPGLFEVPCS